jgi:hypothetical protein
MTDNIISPNNAEVIAICLRLNFGFLCFGKGYYYTIKYKSRQVYIKEQIHCNYRKLDD